MRGESYATKTDYTLTQLTEEALDGYCRQLEQLYNDGEPWTNSDRRLRSGRRRLTRIEFMM